MITNLDLAGAPDFDSQITAELQRISQYLNSISALLSAIFGLATITAVIVGVGALVFSARQTVAARLAAKSSAAVSVSQAYGEISTRMSIITENLLKEPDWIRYFYQNHEPPDGDSHEDTQIRARLDVFCELIMDCADVVSEQRAAAQELAPMDWSTWDAYFRFFYQNSPTLRKHVAENLDYYPDYELATFGYIVVREPLTGEVLSVWDAREINHDPEDGNSDDRYLELFGDGPDARLPPHVGLKGYPWVRTWVIAPAKIKPEPPPARSPSDGAVLVAALEVPESGVAKVHVRTCEEIDREARKTLESWVIGTLTASAKIKNVYVYDAHGDNPRSRHKIGTVRAPERGSCGREIYLLPRFESLPTFQSRLRLRTRRAPNHNPTTMRSLRTSHPNTVGNGE